MRACAACRVQLSVITCMDSRLMMSKMLGLDIGDAEIIRNAGEGVGPGRGGAVGSGPALAGVRWGGVD